MVHYCAVIRQTSGNSLSRVGVQQLIGLVIVPYRELSDSSYGDTSGISVKCILTLVYANTFELHKPVNLDAGHS